MNAVPALRCLNVSSVWTFGESPLLQTSGREKLGYLAFVNMLMLVLAVEFRLAEVALVLPVRRQSRSCPRYPQRSWHPCHTVATLEQSQDAAVSDVSQMRPAIETSSPLSPYSRSGGNSRSTKGNACSLVRKRDKRPLDRDRTSYIFRPSSSSSSSSSSFEKLRVCWRQE